MNGIRRAWRNFNIVKYTGNSARVAVCLIGLGAISLLAGLTLPAGWQVSGGSVELAYPRQIWLGDDGMVTLVLAAEQLPAVTMSGSPLAPATIDLFDVYQVVVEARLELAGMAYSPTGSSLEPISPASQARFAWQVAAIHPGAGEGTVWVHLRLIPKAGGSDIRLPVYAFPVAIAIRDILGVDITLIRWILLGVALVAGVVMGVDVYRRLNAATRT